MTTEQLYKELHYVNHSREHRKRYALMAVDNPEMLKKVMVIAFKVNDKISCRAAWLLEFTARENLKALFPLLDEFTLNMHKVHLDPAVRPVAKICEYLIETYYSKNNQDIRKFLKEEHIKRIIDLCFDYMITDQKIAPQAYSMNVLYLLGQDHDWIHPELVQILERGYPKGSSGYKARARCLLKKIKNN